jgi:hypothetical protein
MNKLKNSWCHTYQAIMDILIPRYCDYTTAPFTGKTSIPAWTSATIAAQTDAGTRLPAPESIAQGTLKCAAWCWQQYQMLNLMRWVRLASPRVEYQGTGRQRIAGPESDWGTILSEWAAASWITYVTGGGGAYESITYIPGMPANFYYIRLYEKKINILKPTATAQHSTGLFVYSHTDTGRTYFSVNGRAQNTYHLIQLWPEAASDGVTVESDYVMGDSFTPNPPPKPGDYTALPQYNYCCDEHSGTGKEVIALLYFEGPNGFTYKNW